MKINNKTDLQVTNIGDFRKYTSSIAPEDMGLAFTMVSKNLYSDPIGSFIREITTNAVDANIDADEDSPVMVHVYEENGIWYIEFKDNGTGMSPEMFEGVYMNWFKSTNRETNRKHGGWGLGSKSPLAYQDSFEITTRYAGREYYYIFTNEGASPSSELINECATVLPNGTTIRVEIKEDDDWKIHRACKRQLAYFKSVYVKNEKYFYDNNFKVYEHDLFYLRTGDRPFGDEMHVCLGQVSYPINWHTLEIDEVNIPVALKFDIGDLDVPLNREAINYTEATKVKLKERITIVTDYLMSMYEEQLDISDLFSYIITMNDMRNNKTNPPLKIGDIEIDMKTARPDIYFNPYEGARIKIKDFATIFCFYTTWVIKNSKNYSQGTETKFYFNLWRNPELCYILTKDSPNYYDSRYIENGYIFKRGKATVRKFKAVADIFSKPVNGYKGNKIRELGVSHKVHTFLTYLDNYLLDKIKTYDGTAPKDWIKRIKDEKKAKREKTKGEVTYYDIENHRSKIKVRDLVNNYKLVFLVSKERSILMKLHYYHLWEKGCKLFKKQSCFLIVSPTVYAQLGKHENVYEAETMFRVNSFKNYLCRLHYSERVKRLSKYNGLFLRSKYYGDIYDKVYKQYSEDGTYRYRDIPDNNGIVDYREVSLAIYFNKQIAKILKETKKSFIYSNHIEELEKLVNKAGIIGYLKSDTPSFIIKDYLVKNKILGFDRYLGIEIVK